MKINWPQIFYYKFIVSAKNIVDFSLLPRRNIMNDWYEKDKAFYPVEFREINLFSVWARKLLWALSIGYDVTYLSIPTPTEKLHMQ